MRIIKTALKQIIKEETERLIMEEEAVDTTTQEQFDVMTHEQQADYLKRMAPPHWTTATPDIGLVDGELVLKQPDWPSPEEMVNWDPEDMPDPTRFQPSIAHIPEPTPKSFKEQADELENNMVTSGVDQFEANMLRNQWLCNETTPQDVLAKGGKCAQGFKSFSHHEFTIRMAKLKQNQIIKEETEKLIKEAAASISKIRPTPTGMPPTYFDETEEGQHTGTAYVSEDDPDIRDTKEQHMAAYEKGGPRYKAWIDRYMTPKDQGGEGLSSEDAIARYHEKVLPLAKKALELPTYAGGSGHTHAISPRHGGEAATSLSLMAKDPAAKFNVGRRSGVELAPGYDVWDRPDVLSHEYAHLLSGYTQGQGVPLSQIAVSEKGLEDRPQWQPRMHSELPQDTYPPLEDQHAAGVKMRSSTAADQLELSQQQRDWVASKWLPGDTSYKGSALDKWNYNRLSNIAPGYFDRARKKKSQGAPVEHWERPWEQAASILGTSAKMHDLVKFGKRKSSIFTKQDIDDIKSGAWEKRWGNNTLSSDLINLLQSPEARNLDSQMQADELNRFSKAPTQQSATRGYA